MNERDPDASERDRDANDRRGTERRSDDALRVSIPEHVGAKIERRLSGTNFDTPDEYVTFVLESILRELDEQGDGEQGDDDVVIEVRDTGRTDEGNLQNRLESLGYL